MCVFGGGGGGGGAPLGFGVVFIVILYISTLKILKKKKMTGFFGFFLA